MGDLVLIPGLGRSSGEGKGYPLQYSGELDCIVHGVSKSQTQLNDFHLTWMSRPVKLSSACQIGEGYTEDILKFSRSVMFNSLWPHGLQHARLAWPSPTPKAYSNSCPLSQWYHPTISSSVIPFSFYLQSCPGLKSFPVSEFFASGGQIIGASVSASVLPMNIQDWFPLGWTGWISLQSKGLSRVFSNTTVQTYVVQISKCGSEGVGKWDLSCGRWYVNFTL